MPSAAFRRVASPLMPDVERLIDYFKYDMAMSGPALGMVFTF